MQQPPYEKCFHNFIRWVFANMLLHEWVQISQTQIFHVHADETVAPQREETQEIVYSVCMNNGLAALQTCPALRQHDMWKVNI